ncbi:hypothetical protein EB233_13190 [Mesorhizobium erdmanii]|uniref:Uncharacterized protein n=1 Tax=Mesorhizobium erdmanii TaxID=1777866 RepID=A0A6M7UEN5_9HYPH|nr:hypothetical protein EB233_13190 [Mesorhizobium erdmanii]
MQQVVHGSATKRPDFPMHRLSVLTALLISFVVAYGMCAWAFAAHPVDLFQAQASPLEIRGSE